MVKSTLIKDVGIEKLNTENGFRATRELENVEIEKLASTCNKRDFQCYITSAASVGGSS